MPRPPRVASKPPTAEKTARTFIMLRGRVRLRRFVGLLVAGESLRTIGEEFGLTHVRVDQLKRQLGTSWSEYRVHSDVEPLLDRIEAEQRAVARAAKQARQAGEP